MFKARQLQIRDCDQVFEVRPLSLAAVAEHHELVNKALKIDAEQGAVAAIPVALDAAFMGIVSPDRQWCLDNLHEGQLLELAYLPRRAARAGDELEKNSVSPSA